MKHGGLVDRIGLMELGQVGSFVEVLGSFVEVLGNVVVGLVVGMIDLQLRLRLRNEIGLGLELL